METPFEKPAVFPSGSIGSALRSQIRQLREILSEPGIKMESNAVTPQTAGWERFYEAGRSAVASEIPRSTLLQDRSETEPRTEMDHLWFLEGAVCMRLRLGVEKAKYSYTTSQDG